MTYRASETIRLSTQQKDLMLSHVQSTTHISCEIHHCNFFSFLVCQWLHGTETACWIILTACTIYRMDMVSCTTFPIDSMRLTQAHPKYWPKLLNHDRTPRDLNKRNTTTLPHLQSWIHFSNLEIQNSTCTIVDWSTVYNSFIKYQHPPSILICM